MTLVTVSLKEDESEALKKIGKTLKTNRHHLIKMAIANFIEKCMEKEGLKIA